MSGSAALPTGNLFPPASPRPARVLSVDALRGLVMVLMALDHTREFFHAGAFNFSPEDLTRTSVALFFTRWVTHICAPVFVFTAGLGACYRLSHGRTAGELSRFLWTRGLWLMVLEVTLLRLLMNFSLFSGPVVLTVLWVIGLSMVVLGFLVRLPQRVHASLALLVILLHNLADKVRAEQFPAASAWIWNLLHQPGFFQVGSVSILVAYTLVPWFAVMAAGFGFGKVMQLEEVQRRKWLVRIGLGATLAFLVLRGLNVYGDPVPWSTQFPGMTWLSFLRTTKYPASLSFLLMTLGPAILLLAWFERFAFTKRSLLVTFGRVPLFYFLAHFFTVHLLAVVFALARYGRATFLFYPLPSSGGPPNLYPQDYGYPLWVVYAVWLLVVLLMAPLCTWFARLRERRSDWWLSYL